MTRSNERTKSGSKKRGSFRSRKTPVPPKRNSSNNTRGNKRVWTKRVQDNTSELFEKAKARAETFSRDFNKLAKLIKEAQEKSEDADASAFKESWAYLMAMIRLLKAYYKGTYRIMPWKSLVTIVGAIIYFAMPLDAIPDFIPVVGYMDDAFVLSLALISVKDDLDEFLRWETTQGV